MEKSEEAYTFGRWVRAWRIHRGLSIKVASQRAGWQPQFWSNLELEKRPRKGGLPPKPGEQTVSVVAKVLDLPARTALLAAGHNPPEWQSQICSLMPDKHSNDSPNPASLPDILMVKKRDNDEKAEYFLLECKNTENKVDIVQEKEIKSDEGVTRRLDYLENYMEHMILALDGREQIKNLAAVIRGRNTSKTSEP